MLANHSLLIVCNYQQLFQVHYYSFYFSTGTDHSHIASYAATYHKYDAMHECVYIDINKVRLRHMD